MRRILNLLPLLALGFLPLTAQSSSPLDRLYDHFVGSWVGDSNNYTENPPVHATIRIEIAREKKGKELHLRYVYNAPGKHGVDYERTIAINPAKQDFFIKLTGKGKGHYQVDGLDELLRDGFGDFRLHGCADTPGDHYALYRGDYHLTATSLSYEIYTSSNGKPFVKNSDWSVVREIHASVPLQP